MMMKGIQMKAIFPLIGMMGSCMFWSKFTETLRLQSASSVTSFTLILYFTVVFTIGMEYVARYQHHYFWHSKFLWCIHSSHHHQRTTKLFCGPTKQDAEANVFILPPTNNKTKNQQQRQLRTVAITESNDIFAAVFCIMAIAVMYWATHPDPNGSSSNEYFRNIAFGASCGISIYGTSYFVGHDLCAHERGGKELANILKKLSPTLAKCAEVHTTCHHKINVDAPDDVDPYGPPYGFWLGPEEVEAYYRTPSNTPDKKATTGTCDKQHHGQILGTPLFIKVLFSVSFLLFLWSLII